MAFPTQARCVACGKAAATFVTFRGLQVGTDHADCRSKVAQSMPSRADMRELEVRSVSLAEFEIRSKAGVAGTFEGYANKWDLVDSYGTRFIRGAWSRGGLDGEPYPLLWMHSPFEPGGTVRASEDSGGLPVEGAWDDTDLGKRMRGQAEGGSAPELSVGFKRLKNLDNDPSAIETAQLREVSQVTARWGSTPGSRVMAVRFSADTAGVAARSVEGSYEDLQDDLREAVQAKYAGAVGSYAYLVATFADRVVFTVCTMGAPDVTYQAPYSLDEATDVVTLGDAREVEVQQVIKASAGGGGAQGAVAAAAGSGSGFVARGVWTPELERRRQVAALALTAPVARSPWRAAELDVRATWTSSYINDLPDSSFLYIEPGGDQDEDGKTKPRSLRHFPVKDASGKVDLPHLRNAMARIPQSDLPQAVKDRVTAKGQKLLDAAKGS
jgi:HK97 family phage prohead protease